MRVINSNQYAKQEKFFEKTVSYRYFQRLKNVFIIYRKILRNFAMCIIMQHVSFCNIVLYHLDNQFLFSLKILSGRDCFLFLPD